MYAGSLSSIPHGLTTDNERIDVQLIDDPYYDDIKLKEFRSKKIKGVSRSKRQSKARKPFGRSSKSGSTSADDSKFTGETVAGDRCHNGIRLITKDSRLASSSLQIYFASYT